MSLLFQFLGFTLAVVSSPVDRLRRKDNTLDFLITVCPGSQVFTFVLDLTNKTKGKRVAFD